MTATWSGVGDRAQAAWVSPLLEVERLAQEEAKAAALDVSDPAGRARLRAMIVAAIETWNGDYRRGVRPFAIAEPHVVEDRAFRNLAGYGPLEPLLRDPDVWEIMINGPDAVFVRRHRGASGYHDEVFHDDDHVIRILTRILDDSSGSHRKLDPTEGLQDARLDDGSRLHIVHGDIGRDGHVLVNIRKFTGLPHRSLDELVETGMLSPPAADFLRACMRARLSIVFAGAPGSGKTTLLSCCAAELDPGLRVVVAEEVFETDVAMPNLAHMQTRPRRADRGEVDLRRLVSGFLRMAPDVAIVGEVRDREALPLLLTLSSGIKGYTTIHAGSARQALSRLRFICQLGDTSSPIPLSALNSLVSEAVDIVVHCRREGDRVQVTEVIAVEDLQSGPDSYAFTTTDLFRLNDRSGVLGWTGSLPQRAAPSFEAAGIDLLGLLGDGSAGGARSRRIERLAGGTEGMDITGADR
ncbi:MAG TPA: ATPase, T2SS/T4P/T4SS family [Acidimicrobiales bacterium]|nr:ATPase, T2SS/T4P/T4SS family [Acidimicrobiales bacterium]